MADCNICSVWLKDTLKPDDLDIWEGKMCHKKCKSELTSYNDTIDADELIKLQDKIIADERVAQWEVRTQEEVDEEELRERENRRTLYNSMLRGEDDEVLIQMIPRNHGRTERRRLRDRLWGINRPQQGTVPGVFTVAGGQRIRAGDLVTLDDNGRVMLAQGHATAILGVAQESDTGRRTIRVISQETHDQQQERIQEHQRQLEVEAAAAAIEAAVLARNIPEPRPISINSLEWIFRSESGHVWQQLYMRGINIGFFVSEIQMTIFNSTNNMVNTKRLEKFGWNYAFNTEERERNPNLIGFSIECGKLTTWLDTQNFHRIELSIPLEFGERNNHYRMHWNYVITIRNLSINYMHQAEEFYVQGSGRYIIEEITDDDSYTDNDNNNDTIEAEIVEDE